MTDRTVILKHLMWPEAYVDGKATWEDLEHEDVPLRRLRHRLRHASADADAARRLRRPPAASAAASTAASADASRPSSLNSLDKSWMPMLPTAAARLRRLLDSSAASTKKNGKQNVRLGTHRGRCFTVRVNFIRRG